MLFVLF